MDLKEEDILGDAIYEHWYYLAKGRALTTFLGDVKTSEVLDVGAGSGIFSRRILDAGIAEKAVCVDPGYNRERTDRYNGKPIAFVHQVEAVPQSLILMMDVLEHVDDDVALLKAYGDLMPDDGQVLITVPAFQFLWSGHDVFLEHRRRYTIGTIEEVVRKAGLEPVKSRYFFGLLFPAVALIRLVKGVFYKQGTMKAKSEMAVAPDWLNKALIFVHDLERPTLFKINRLAGLSVFCLCRKP